LLANRRSLIPDLEVTLDETGTPIEAAAIMKIDSCDKVQVTFSETGLPNK